MSIRILSAETRAKIAAGEVIIRPASVVKELLENSLDAGARRIDIYLEEGGKKLIQIADDGEGINSEEIELATQRYGTSKLSTTQDLMRIESYGFRGEALASIAEVSELSIQTQKKETQTGVSVRIKAGRVLERKEFVRSQGTTVSVRNLFFNLPARRSFLRSEPYERRLILGIVRDYALQEPSIRFEIRNRRKVIACYQPTDDWTKRIKEVHPQLNKEEFIPVHAEHRLLSVHGILIKPDLSRRMPKIQRTFFNARPVIYRTVYRAIMEGFGVQSGNALPLFIFKLTCPADMLDVNIHPAKTEVRYRDERFLFDFISQAVRKAVHDEAVESIHSLSLPKSSPLRPYPKPSTHPNIPNESKNQLFVEGLTSTSSSTKLISSDPSLSITEDNLQEPEVHQASFWQLQNAYILAQVSSGLIVVDQHAAHERILYEEMLEQLKSSPRQRLLFPLIVDLNPEEFATFEEIADHLPTLGLEAKVFGPNQVIIETLPVDAKMGPQELAMLFRDFAETNEVKLGNRDKMAAIIACHGAIKAGRNLSQDEMESLINRLFQCNTPYFCPHGRPTVIKFTMSDLDKRFGRF